MRRRTTAVSVGGVGEGGGSGGGSGGGNNGGGDGGCGGGGAVPVAVVTVAV